MTVLPSEDYEHLTELSGRGGRFNASSKKDLKVFTVPNVLDLVYEIRRSIRGHLGAPSTTDELRLALEWSLEELPSALGIDEDMLWDQVERTSQGYSDKGPQQSSHQSNVSEEGHRDSELAHFASPAIEGLTDLQFDEVERLYFEELRKRCFTIKEAAQVSGKHRDAVKRRYDKLDERKNT